MVYSWISKDGIETIYPHKEYMAKCYQKNKARYAEKLYCELCDKHYTKNNTYNHMTSKFHLKIEERIKKIITNAAPESSNDTQPLDERHKHL